MGNDDCRNVSGVISSSSRASRVGALKAAAKERILVLDGATGTALQAFPLTAEDFGGARFEGCNENLVLTRPDIVAEVHHTYLKAGCDIVETNTFGGTPLVLAEFDLSDKAYEINKRAAEIARETCAKYDEPGRLRFVAGSIGPTTKSLCLTGGVTFDELTEHFYEQVRGLFDGGADYFLLETCNDTLNIKAAFIAIDRLFAERGESLPVAVSATIENTGTMLAGQSIEALATSIMHRELLYLGLNCATGPEFMTDHIRSLSRLSPFPIACVPNAGLPDENGHYLESPEMVAKIVDRFMDKGWINFIGGCCGTHAGHIKSLVEVARTRKPRQAEVEKRAILSGVDHLEITHEMRPVIVGERTNVIGSRKFKDLITASKFEEASEVARLQVKAGAQIVDVCLANTESDELRDMELFLERATRKVRVPLMIDSTDSKVIAKALTYCQGKAVINSINLEDGEERFEEVAPLAKKFGAAVVVGTIDEDPLQGMAVTRERKLQIAERSFKLLTEKYGIPAEDIYFDPLVFPCGTGDDAYRTSAPETIEGLRLIKERFPRCKTVLGISNVSFGLPAAGREVLNSVFLYHCVQAGLDLALVNSEKLERYASLDTEDIRLSEDILFSRGEDPVAAFTARFRERKVKKADDRSSSTLEERLGSYVIEGAKEGLIEDLGEALKKYKPLDIINGPLMAGMAEVGRLFNANKLIVAEVLQSAEVMKTAVAFLEPHMEKSDVMTRGKVLLATVKGDVHDIGKNLVDIILSNNGFEVINLGIKVPPEQLIQAAREHKPDMIGLSGLLVKSAQQMVTTAEDLSRAGIEIPILVGGAALSRGFAEKRILPAYGSGAVLYAQDAMNGLELANRVVDPAAFATLRTELEEKKRRLTLVPVEEAAKPSAVEADRPRKQVTRLDSNPVPPDFARHIQRQVPIEQIWKWVNPLMLYTRHLGVKAKSARLLDQAMKDPVLSRKLREEDPTAVDVWEQVQEVKALFGSTEVLRPNAVYQFFHAASEGNSIFLFESETNRQKPVARFDFERQTKGDLLCLSDYLSPIDGPNDAIGMFVTTVGNGVREASAELKAKGQFLKSHILQALAIESAEAYAEWMHSFIRSSWGFPDDPAMSMMERFQAKYRGKRYSFGYPACPNLEDQAKLFALLRPEDIGVNLTEGFMMDPEASVSAIVFHHPDAKYFGVAGAMGSEVQGDEA